MASDSIGDELARQWCDPAIGQETLAFLQYTSGSTDEPKGVMVTHGNLLHNLAAIGRSFRATAESRGVFWLPLYHDMGLIGGVLQTLYCGGASLLMSPVAFLQKPVRWLEAISETGATISGAPNFAYDLCVRKTTREERARLDLSRWSVAFSGAEPVRAETLDRFTEAFAPSGFRRDAFLPCYGLAEATLLVSGRSEIVPPIVLSFAAGSLEHNRVSPARDTGLAERTLVGCGRVIHEHEVVIVDPATGLKCKPDSVGEIWVAGPSVAHGYWNRPDETAATFATRLGSGRTRYLRTGDLGFLRDGELFVTGRLKDLIIIHGRNIYPQDIEATVGRSHPLLRQREVRRSRSHRMARNASSSPARSSAAPVAGRPTRSPRRFGKRSPLSTTLTSIACSCSRRQAFPRRQAARSAAKPAAGDSSRERSIWSGSRTGSKSRAWPGQPRCRTRLILARTCRPPRQRRRPRFRRGLPPRSRTCLGSIRPRSISTGRCLSLDSARCARSVWQATFSSGSAGLSSRRFSIATQRSQSSRPSWPKRRTNSASRRQALSACFRPSKHLSVGQSSLWSLHQLNPQSAAYNIAVAVQIHGMVDFVALERAFQVLVDRHAALRARFLAVDGQPHRQLYASAQVDFCVQEVTDLSEADLSSRIVAEAQRPFDLENAPLLRVRVFSHARRDPILVLAIHHVVSDFWSVAILIDELGKIYPAIRDGRSIDLAPPSCQATDFARWQATRLAGQEGERLWAYWQSQLTGPLPVLDFPTDRPRPALQTDRGARCSLQLDRALTERLLALGTEHGSSLYITLLAAFQVLLHRYTGQDELIIGSPVSGRSLPEFAGVVGYLVNTLPLRSDLAGNPSYASFLGQVRRTVLEGLEHQDFPFALMVDRARPAARPEPHSRVPGDVRLPAGTGS